MQGSLYYIQEVHKNASGKNLTFRIVTTQGMNRASLFPACPLLLWWLSRYFLEIYLFSELKKNYLKNQMLIAYSQSFTSLIEGRSLAEQFLQGNCLCLD